MTKLTAKRGLILLNLGTPDEPTPRAVGRYLREFLMDKFVIDIAWPLRWFLVNVLIVPKRKHESAALYKTIWEEEGSPLLIHLRALGSQVRALLGSEYQTVIAMRYGQPSIASALEELRLAGVNEITVFPLYPQYAESSTRSSVEAIRAVAAEMGYAATISFVPAFYQHPLFIKPFAARLRSVWSESGAEHLLMSFHGLPERHVRATDRSAGQTHCLRSAGCCDKIVEANRDCYRAQCFATARALASEVGLRADQYTVCFQSRLGRDPWIKPYTDYVIPEIAAKGVRRLAVVCPAFVADCLETLEEIEERGATLFRESGGDTLSAVPCLNSDPAWAAGVAAMVRDVRG